MDAAERREIYFQRRRRRRGHFAAGFPPTGMGDAGAWDQDEERVRPQVPGFLDIPGDPAGRVLGFDDQLSTAKIRQHINRPAPRTDSYGMFQRDVCPQGSTMGDYRRQQDLVVNVAASHAVPPALVTASYAGAKGSKTLA